MKFLENLIVICVKMFNKNKLSHLLIPIFVLCAQTLNIKADGAGILPFVKEKNQIFFLVSEDRHRLGVWTDFGGKGEANIDDAAKEGHEETMGIFTGHHKKPYRQKYDAIPLLKQKLNEKMCLRKHFFDCEYATYIFDATQSVRRLDGMEKTIKLFYSTLERLKNKSNRYIYRCYSEKESFLWITKKELLQAIDKNKSIKGKKLYKPFRDNLLQHRELIASL